MGFGVLESKEVVVPGTIQLLDTNEHDEAVPSRPLKRAGDGVVILNPQPSDDPNDPLNWPIWQRDLSYLIILLGSVLSLVHSPILAPVTLELAMEYNKTIADISHLTLYSLLAVCICAYLFSILSRRYGKRGLFLLAIAILLASDVWAGKANSFESMMGARVVSGVGQAMFEALSFAMVPDLFFVHERGLRIALSLFVSQTGVTLGQPIAIRIATGFGLNWSFYGLAISESIVFLLLFFFFYESTFPRADINTLQNPVGDEEDSKVNVDHHETAGEALPLERVGTNTAIPGRMPYIKRLKVYSGTISKYNIAALAWRTLALTFHPAIAWAAISGLTISWPVGISYTVVLVLQVPPYNFSSNGVANMYIAAWLGAMLSWILGSFQDPFIKWMARRNRNVYEPEFRLWFTIPAIVLFVLGMAGWGWGAHAGVHWIGLAFFLAFTFTGALLTNVAVIGYILDGYRMYAVESQVTLFAFKNLFAFAMGYYFVDWYQAAGPKEVFGIISGISAGIALTTVPIYVYGKRMRSYWARTPYLGIKDMVE